MDELKKIIARNLIAYRKTSGLTQSDLAEKINYSDKAVSKWERAEGVPDIYTLKALADIFGVTVNDIITEHTENKDIVIPNKQLTDRMRFIITIISATLVWFVATLIYVIFLLTHTLPNDAWMTFVFAIPVCLTVLLIFNVLWGKMFFTYILISAIIWSTAGCIYMPLSYIDEMWLTFIIAIPLQILTVFWFLLRTVWRKKIKWLKILNKNNKKQ